MQPVLLLDVVGLTRRQIGSATPELAALARRGACVPLRAMLPAVTCSVQATLLTGTPPREHGAVGNGWLFRDTGEVRFWQQSSTLVAGEKLYERARKNDPRFTCAKLFWWWNQGAAVDWSVTPKPWYGADGSKVFAVDGSPRAWVAELVAELGEFPFFDFWGPRAGLASSAWIAAAAARTLARERPSLTMAYLPHLDYDPQRHGPDDPRSLAALRDVDRLVGELVAAADAAGAAVVVVSEYGIERADTVSYPNRALRSAGLLEVRPGPFGEQLDVHGSRAFAVADHQIAHVYARTPRDCAAARECLASDPAVARVLDADGKEEHGLDHARAGELVLLARKGAWFAYPYWLDDDAAPDFARTVDIHRKPGYDPCELFVDPRLRWPKLRVARRLLQKKLGMRYRMDVIPLDASLVRGTHGRIPDDVDDGPVLVSSVPLADLGGEPRGGAIPMTEMRDRLLLLLGARSGSGDQA